MAERRQDLRIIKTERALAQALLALLEKQSFSKITINDICNEAMVSRSTFYAHFEDKYKLLYFCMQEVGCRIFADAKEENMRETLLKVLANMQQDAKMLRNLMLAELDIELVEMLRQHFVQIFMNQLQHKGYDNIPAAKAEVVASFYSAGVSQTLALWLEKRLPIGTEEMADTLYALLQGLEQPLTNLLIE